MNKCNVTEATHVKIFGVIRRIVEKWGISPHGHLAKPSEGGFGVVTEDGLCVGMWQVEAYYKEEGTGQ